MLSNVPKRKEAVMWLVEKIRVLDELPSATNDGAVGHEFHVNEATIYIKKVSLNRNTQKTR